MLTIDLLKPLLRAAWGPDTCDPHDLAGWRPDNPARGQCGTTALVIQDLLGGDLMLGRVHVDGRQVGYHWWNRLPDGTVVDLTAEQFLPGETVTGGEIRHRPVDAPRRCQGQYALLRHRVLGSGHPERSLPVSRIAVVAVTDPAGAVLLRPPAANAGTDPGQWSLPGGPIARGETPADAAARGLTGLAAPDLRAIWSELRPDLTGCASAVELHAFAGRTTGAAGFIPVADLPDVNLGPTAAAVLHRLLDR